MVGFGIGGDSSDEENKRTDSEVIKMYESDKMHQGQRMQRRARMKAIENPKFTRMNEIRATIAEINRAREFQLLQKADISLPLEPVFESVQSLIGKQNAKEVRTFTGKEIVRLDDSCLVEIPRVEDQSDAYRILKANLRNHSSLLEPGRIANEIATLEKKQTRLSNVLFKAAPGSGLAAQNIEEKQEKKQSVKQISIINRIMQSEKLFEKAKQATVCEAMTEKLKKKKNKVLEDFELAARLRKMQASNVTANPGTPIAAVITASTPIKNSNSNNNDRMSNYQPHKNSAMRSPKGAAAAATMNLEVTQVNSPTRKDLMYNSRSSGVKSRQQLLGKMDENQTPPMDSSRKSFTGQMQQYTQQQSIFTYNGSNARDDAEISIDAGSLDQSDSLQSLELQKEDDQSKGQGIAEEQVGRASRMKIRRRKQEEIDELEELKATNPNSILLLLRSSKSSKSNNNMEKRKQISGMSSTEPDATMKEHVDWRRQRSKRMMNVKKKLGLLDAVTMKKEELQIINDEMKKIVEEQEKFQKDSMQHDISQVQQQQQQQQQQFRLKKQKSLASNGSRQYLHSQSLMHQAQLNTTSTHTIPTITVIREEVPGDQQMLKLASNRKIFFTDENDLTHTSTTKTRKLQSSSQSQAVQNQIRKGNSYSRYERNNASAFIRHSNSTSLQMIPQNSEFRPTSTSKFEGGRDLDLTATTTHHHNNNYHYNNNSSNMSGQLYFLNGGKKADGSSRIQRNGKSMNLELSDTKKWVTAQHSTQSNSRIDRVVEEWKPIDPMIEFYKKKVILKKEFGQRVSAGDRIALKCKGQMNSFFNDLLHFQESSNAEDMRVKLSMRSGFSKIDEDFQRWNNGFLDSNENFEIALAQEVINSVKSDAAVVAV